MKTNDNKQITTIESNNRKKITKKGMALLKLLISSSIILTACTNNNQKKYNNSSQTVAETIKTTDTEESIMYENSLNTIMYYNNNLECNSTLYVRKTIEDLEKLYYDSIENNNIENANTYLYCIIYLIMECQLTDALSIDTASNMVYFDVNYDKNYLSIIKDNIHKEKRYYLDNKVLKKAAKYLEILEKKEALYGSNDEYDIEYIHEIAKELSQKTGRITGDIFTKKKIMLTNK